MDCARCYAPARNNKGGKQAVLHGLMVVNAFLRTTKFDDIYHTLLSGEADEASQMPKASGLFVHRTN